MTAVFTWVDTCESTSKILKVELRGGINEITGLASGAQTDGVGRMGHAWESLPGNVHLSLAIPGRMINPALVPLLPLWLGARLALWIQRKIGVRVCLKWPNDLILDGRKIGGLLCEGVFQGNDLSGVVLGIGVNLTAAPVLPPPYQSGDLRDLTGVCLNPREVSRELFDWLSVGVASLDSVSTILEAWSCYGIRSGHLWRSPDRQWHRGAGINGDGECQFESLNTGQTSIVSSAIHGFQWSSMMNKNILVADIGNSRSKLARVAMSEDGLPAIGEYIDHSSPDGLARLAKMLKDLDVAPVVHAVVVNPAGEHELKTALRTVNVDLRPVTRNPVRMMSSNYDLGLIGMDRLAALEWLYASYHRAQVSWPAMIVSLGTATTLDAVDGAGTHLGGYIAPGVGSMLECISSRGALLPKNLEIRSNEDSEKWPENSRDAMVHASIRMTAAWIRSERERLATRCGVKTASVSLMIHGGHSALISPLFRDDATRVVEGVPLLGAALLVMNGR